MCKHDDDMMAGDDEKAWENKNMRKFVNSFEKNCDNMARIIMNTLGHFLGNNDENYLRNDEGIIMRIIRRIKMIKLTS